MLCRYPSLLFPSFLCDISGVAATLCKELTARGRVGMQGRGERLVQLWGLRISANEMEMGAVPGQHNPGPGTTMAPCPSCAPILLDSKMSQAPDSREILELSLALTGSLLLLLLLSSCSTLREMHHRCLNTPK